MERNYTGRRDFLRKGSVLIAAAGAGMLQSCVGKTVNIELQFPLQEQLMRENGMLSRGLLVYELCLTRFKHHAEFPTGLVNSVAGIIKEFIIERHQRFEEEYLFPILEKETEQGDLISVLRKQHQAGAALTAQILEYSKPSAPAGKKGIARLAKLISDQVIMSRPHMDRENTVLLPAFRKLALKSGKTFSDEWNEKKNYLLNEDEFEKVLSEIEDIEKQAGLFELDKFTPQWYEYKSKPVIQLTSA